MAKRSSRIVGGTVTEKNEYPWQVGLVNKDDNYVWCGASLISNQWILTAAHCTAGEALGDLQVLLGVHNYNHEGATTTIRMDISEIVDHPDYESRSTNYDFSLLKMATPLNFDDYPHIRPVCLPENDSNDYSGFVATVTGWGTTASGGSTSNKLREVNVDVISNDQCRNDFSYSSSSITDQMMCAYVPGGGKDACQGDSGEVGFS